MPTRYVEEDERSFVVVYCPLGSGECSKVHVFEPTDEQVCARCGGGQDAHPQSLEAHLAAHVRYEWGKAGSKMDVAAIVAESDALYALEVARLLPQPKRVRRFDHKAVGI